MVIETPEGLTLVEPTDNSSFYIVQEHEGHETPLGTFNIHGVIQVFQRLHLSILDLILFCLKTSKILKQW